jgi:hypothetical protein
MGGEMTRVTFVGAVLIITVILLLLFAIQLLTEENNPDHRIDGE